MNNKEFDDIIKKKLESLNTNGSDGAWDLFKEKWENESSLEAGHMAPSVEDEILDAKIKKDMQTLRIPFNSKHWIILKEQLELEALFKKKLFVAKSVELVILAFLVLGILNLWPIQNNIHHIPVNGIPMVASVPVDKETAEKHKAQEEARLAEQVALNHQIYNSTKKLVQKAIQSVDVLASDQNNSSSDNNVKTDIIKAKSATQGTKENKIYNTHNPFPFINIPLQQSQEKSKKRILSQSTDNNSFALLETNEIKELSIPVRPIGYPDITLESQIAKKEENTYVSFSIGPKMNLINSPFDPVYEIDPYNTINTNFNISAKIQKEIGPIELYAGLGYSNTSYVPRLVDEIYEPLERQFNVASLENIQFKTFNIPVGVKYNLIESKNYQFYASAGVDLNIIADSEYTIQDVPVGSRSEPAVPPSGMQPPKSKNNTVNSNAKLSQKEFNSGILSGGNLRDNLYASASVGFGLNWNPVSKFGLFIEPRYSHFISSKGIGPNADKVHGLSIDVGVRYQLN